MKHGKRPTRAQKMMLRAMGLNYWNWLIVEDSPMRLVIVHRHSGKTKVKNRRMEL